MDVPKPTLSRTSRSPGPRPEKRPRLDPEDGALMEDVEHEVPIDAVDTEGLPAAVTSGFTNRGKGHKAGKKAAKYERARRAGPEPGSAEEVNWLEVVELLGKEAVDEAIAAKTDWDQVYALRDEVECVIEAISSSGHGIARAPNMDRTWALVIPFCLPGETVRARVYKNRRMHSLADCVEVITPNPELRDDSRVKCRYFGKCGGCQYQMLSYEKQLELKRDVVVKAYRHYSELPASSVPEILPTFPSPKQYGYRTKLTPHFDAPPKAIRRENGMPIQGGYPIEEKPDWLKIGFNTTGTVHVMDIEECPIGTPAINEQFGPVRKEIVENIWKYQKAVSLLFRDSLRITPHTTGLDIHGSRSPTPEAETEEEARGVVITDMRKICRESVGSKRFDYVASEFFQNNNAILEPLTAYVRDAIFADDARPTHLVDAYCGAGLFAIALADDFAHVAGIEISPHAIRYAIHNRALNRIPPEKMAFYADDASEIFAHVGEFPRDKSVVVIDPPRKGTSEEFIEQLVGFGAGRVVYVSCNVHTQARDVGMIIRRSEERAAAGTGGRYVLETLRGFDLFPQTAHVEGVAVLKLVT